MHLSKEQEKRFYTLFYQFMSYANSYFQIVPGEFEPWKQDANPEELQRVIDKVVATPGFFDEFASRNPLFLSREDLGQVNEWRYGVTDQFVAMRADSHYTTLLANDYLFGMVGLSKEIGPLLGELPVMVRTTLLPFDGLIVFGVNVSSYPLAFGKDMKDMLEQDYKKCVREGRVVTTAEDFIAAHDDYHKRKAAAEEERAAHQAAIERTAKEPVPGTHRGALAGLSARERERAIKRYTKANRDNSAMEVEDDRPASKADHATPEEHAQRIKEQHALHTVMVYTDLCGIISSSDLAKRNAVHYPGELGEKEILALVRRKQHTEGAPCNLWAYGSDTYYVNWQLTPGYLERGAEQELLDRATAATDPDDLSEQDMATAACLIINDNHRGKPVVDLPQNGMDHLKSFDDYTVLDQVSRAKSTDALRAYLNEHIPDDENDYFYANSVIESAAATISTGKSYTFVLQKIVEEEHIAATEGHFNMLANALVQFARGVPEWNENGWSGEYFEAYQERKRQQSDQSAAEGGARADAEGGKPKKIGRNDPCPCGSGLKYKKCCGR